MGCSSAYATASGMCSTGTPRQNTCHTPARTAPSHSFMYQAFTGLVVQLKVPPGSQSGQRLRLRGKGAPDPKGGEPGDLYARLMVQVPPGDSAGRLADALSELERAYGEDPRARLSL